MAPPSGRALRESLAPGTDLPVKGLFFSEEAENLTFRPPVASKQTNPILNLKYRKNG
jgi:hypothetical protein